MNETTFWRKDGLSDEESHLLGKLLSAHYQSCFRDNASSTAVILAADASGDFGKAVIAAISTMGSRHAPVEETVRFLSLDKPWLEVASILEQGRKVPGWGGSFQKEGKADPLWTEVDDLIEAYHTELHGKLKAVTYQLKEHGKLLSPNPSAYTACVAIALGMPAKLAPYLFIYGRITGWARIAAGYLGG